MAIKGGVGATPETLMRQAEMHDDLACPAESGQPGKPPAPRPTLCDTRSPRGSRANLLLAHVEGERGNGGDMRTHGKGEKGSCTGWLTRTHPCDGGGTTPSHAIGLHQRMRMRHHVMASCSPSTESTPVATMRCGLRRRSCSARASLHEGMLDNIWHCAFVFPPLRRNIYIDCVCACVCACAYRERE